MLEPRDCIVSSITVELAGPLLIGNQLGWALFGVLGVQVYIFSQTSTIISWRPRALVYISFLVQTAQVILTSHDDFWQLGFSYGDFQGLTAVYTSWITIPWLTSITGAAIQCFYAHHVHSLGRGKVWSLLIAASALLQCSAAMAVGSEILRHGDPLGMHRQTHNASLAWLSSNVACNILISTAVLYSRFKSPKFFSTGDTLINKFRIVFVESGLLAAIVSSLALIFFLARRRTFYYIAPVLVLSKLYCNSLLALLNNHFTFRTSKRTVPVSTFDFNSHATYARTSTVVEQHSHTDLDITLSTEGPPPSADHSAVEEVERDDADRPPGEEDTRQDSTAVS